MMKRRMIALPFALTSLLMLGACGDDDTDVEEIEINDPVIEDDGENDADVENEVNDEDVEVIEENEDAEMQEEGSINDSTDDANN